MNREELFASIVAARPGRDDLVYLERRGDAYDWRIVGATADSLGRCPSSIGSATAADPDVWMSFSAAWPTDDPARLRAFFDDLLAELESMADPADRCRWPLDEPWPHFH
ncbi:MAG: hypothetical protein JOZ49_09900 [Mycolicibacterium sp.]|nr:hypothetical protein [Mycolicibacterium sp.]